MYVQCWFCGPDEAIFMIMHT